MRNYLKFLLEAPEEKEVNDTTKTNDDESDTTDMSADVADSESSTDDTSSEDSTEGDEEETSDTSTSPDISSSNLDDGSDSNTGSDDTSSDSEGVDPEEQQFEFNTRDMIRDSLASAKYTLTSLQDFLTKAKIQYTFDMRVEKVIDRLVNKINFDIVSIDDLIETDAYSAMDLELLKSLYKIYIMDIKKMKTIVKDILTQLSDIEQSKKSGKK